MKSPYIGEVYKHYKGNKYLVVDVKNDTVVLMKDNEVYNVGLDFWNTPVVETNGMVVERFRKITDLKGVYNGEGKKTNRTHAKTCRTHSTDNSKRNNM